MQDLEKTKDQLIDELNEMRRKVAEFHSVQKSSDENESRYREIIDKTNEAIFVIQDGWIKFANKNTSEIIGYSTEEVLTSAAIGAFVHPDDREMVARYHASRLQGDETHYRYAFRIVRKDGNLQWVEMNSSLMMWEGRPAALCLMADITERKQAETSLLDRERHFRSLLETIPDALVVYDDRGKVTFVNKAFEELYGWSTEELVGKLLENFVPPSEEEITKQSWERTLQGENVVFETQRWTKEGKVLDLQISTATLRDMAGEHLASIIIHRDITAKKRAAEEFHRSEQKYRQIFDHSPLGILHFDYEGTITACNDNFVQIIGSSREKLVGLNMVNDLKNLQIVAAVKHALSGRIGHYEGEYASVTSDKITPVKVDFSPLLDESDLVVGGIGITEDITERKLMERALIEGEKELKGILSASPVGIVHTRESRIVWANHTWEEMFGFGNEQEYIGQHTSIMHPSEVKYKHVRSMLYENVGRGEVSQTDAKLRTKDGSVFDAHIRINLLDPEDTTKGTISVIADISETKAMGEALKAEKRRFEMLAKNSPFGMVTILRDGRFSYANPKFKEMFGYDLNDVPNGREWLRKAYPDAGYRHEVISAWIEDFKDIAPGETRPRVYSVICKDGNEKIVHFRPVKLDSGEDLMTCEDITERKGVEDALRRTRQDWEDIFQAIGHPTIIMDKEHRILAANKATIVATGKSLTELLNARCYEIFHNGGEAPQGCPMETLLKSGSKEPMEMEMEAFGGHFLVSCTPVLNKDGVTEKIIHIATDVTERWRAEEALKESERRSAQIIEFLPDATMVIDAQGKLIAWNQAIENLTGIKASSMLGKGDYEYALPFYGQRRPVMLDLVIKPDEEASSKYVYFQGERDKLVSETYLPDFCGRGPTWLWNIAAPLYDEDRQVVGAIEAIRDITDRKRTEEQLRESEEKYRSLFEDSIDGIFINEVDGTLVDANQSFLDLFGYTKEEILGKSVIKTYANPEDRELFRQEIEKYGSVKDYPLSLVQKDGAEMDCLLTGTVRKGIDGRILGYRGIIRDVTERKRTEEALLNEKTLTDRVIDSLPGVFYLFDTDGRFLRWNKNFERVSGRSAQEIVAMHPLDAISPEHKLAVENAIRETFESGEATVEADIFSKDGSKIPHLFTGKQISLGLTPCLVGMGIDNTALKLAEEDLHKKTEMLRSMFHASPEAIIVLDPQGIVKMWNPSAERIFGWTETEAVGCFNPVVPDSKREEFRILRDRVLSGESFSGVELTRLRKDGTAIEISVSTAPLKGPGGNIEGILSISADITKRKRAEEDQKRLATAVEQSIEAIMITDRNGIIQYINPAFEHISGYRKEEVIGRDTRFLKSDKFDSSFYKDTWAAVKNGKPWKGRLLSQRKDGSIFYEDVTISPVRDSSGEIINFVDVGHDVTENVELQMQLLQAQKMEAVGTLAGGIAHDFNNLLQAVLGYSEFMLQRKKIGEKDHSDLQKIYKAGKRGADLVKSLMTFSQKVETKYIPLNLNQEITQVQQLLSRTIPKTIKIDLRLSGDLESIKADPSQIGQVLMNLGVNARDAMPDGGTLTIETANVQLDKEYCRSHIAAMPGNYVLLTVSDTGQGMDRKTLTHIFEPFFSTKEVGKGTGLGLAIVYGIVKQHDGHIICYSEPGHGTTFKIYLPATQTKKDLETPTFETAIPDGTETILLVDDDDDIRDLAATILIDFGYKVITAANGKQALEIYQSESESISLIILDLIMPEMDGTQCLAEILRVDPTALVIIASGYSESGPANTVMSAGAKGFVQKPYNMRQLLTTIREVLDEDLPGPVNTEEG